VSDQLREQVRNNLNLKDIYELLEIWRVNNRVIWSETTFEVLREILKERIGEVPPQDDPILESDDSENENNEVEDGREEWEAKLLEDENQPELYSVAEVLKLKDNINKVAIGVIVVYVLLGLLNFQFVRAVLQGIPISLSEVLRSLSNEMFTILTIGLQIVITYFPLKALTHILRILMEMEFRSRKAN
jgi:hypothetical protein